MLPLALILLASSQRVQLFQGVFQVPPGEWHAEKIGLRQRRPVVIAADFSVRSGPPQIRLALLRREDWERFEEGRPNGFLALTPVGTSGRLRYFVRVPGDYVVLLQNRAGDKGSASAELRVVLDFGERAGPAVTGLSPTRQLTVILISFAVFFAIVTYSARRLLRGMKP
jgi:hypothetical protein